MECVSIETIMRCGGDMAIEEKVGKVWRVEKRSERRAGEGTEEKEADWTKGELEIMGKLT